MDRLGAFEMDEQMIEKLCVGIAQAVKEQLDSQRPSERLRRTPSWIAVGTLLLAVVVPICSFTFSLSNRVAVLESKSNDLADASTQLARLTQKVEDFQREFEDWKSETSGVPYRRTGANHDLAQTGR